MHTIPEQSWRALIVYKFHVISRNPLGISLQIMALCSCLVLSYITTHPFLQPAKYHMTDIWDKNNHYHTNMKYVCAILCEHNQTKQTFLHCGFINLTIPSEVCLPSYLMESFSHHIPSLVNHLSEERVRLLEESTWPVKLHHLSSTHHLQHMIHTVSQCSLI